MNTSVLQLDPQTAELLYGSHDINIQVGSSGSILLLCGLQLMFFGFRCFRTTMVVVGFLIFGALTWIGMVNNKPMDGYSRDAITMFIVPFCLGLVGALVCFYFWKLFVGLITLLGGLILAFYICCWRDDLVIPSEQGRIGFFIGCPLLMLFLYKWKKKPILIFSLSFSGAFVFILGIDLLAHTGYVTAYWHMLASKVILAKAAASNNNPSLFAITRLMYIMQCATLFVFLVSFLWQIIVHYHDPAFGIPKPPTPISPSSPPDHQQPDIEQQQQMASIPVRQSSLMAPPSPLFIPRRPPTTSSVSVSPTPTHLDSNHHHSSPPSTTQLPMPVTSPSNTSSSVAATAAVVSSPLAHYQAPASSSSSSSPTSSSLPNTPSVTRSLQSNSSPLSHSETPSSSSSQEIQRHQRHQQQPLSFLSHPSRSVHTL